MKELIAGRIKKDDRPISELMIELLFDGLAGRVVLSEVESTNRKGFTTVHRQFVSPAVFLKALHDYMQKMRDRAMKKAELAKKENGSSGGIRIVLPTYPIADPLLRPGQPPRPLRLLGQNPSKPMTGRQEPESGPSTASHEPRVAPASHAGGEPESRSGEARGQYPARPAPPPAPKPAFDPSELMEDFEHPICQFCMGTGWVRDENGIHMVTCDYCAGEGQAPAPTPPS